MPVGMAHDDAGNTAISLLDEVKIQARVLIPVLRALRTDLGEATANRLVRTALRDWSRQLAEELGSPGPGLGGEHLGVEQHRFQMAFSSPTNRGGNHLPPRSVYGLLMTCL